MSDPLGIKPDIRTVDNFPIPGIRFRDITNLLETPETFSKVCKELTRITQEFGANKIISIESRGFIFAGSVAKDLQLPFILARKPGKLPNETYKKNFDLEYGSTTIEIQKNTSISSIDKIVIIVHNCGGPISFSYAQTCQNKVRKIVLIDVPIPGDGSAVFSENRWHHQFHKIIDLPEELTIDREEIYLNYFYNNWSGKNFVMEKDAQKKYLDAYANKNAMKSGFEYYRALPQDIKDNLKFLKKGKLNIPFLGIAGGEGYGRGIEIILKSLKRVTNNYEGYEISNCGHWVAEEEPELISKYIIKFFNKK